jgi:acetyltransferase-like isoleucine patch superfamily enzyme
MPNLMFFLNPIRKLDIQKSTIRQKVIYNIKHFIIKIGVYFGFTNIDYTYVHGDKKRIHIGKNCSTMNSIFNVLSGEIYIGDNTLFGHNCMVLTGTHQFTDGIRNSLHADKSLVETPVSGRDVNIGSGCFIGSGVTIVGPVTIGNNVIIGAGSLITKPIPDSCFAAGVPAKVIKRTIDIK